MEMDVRGKEKRVYIWLTRGESQNAGLKKSLKELYREYKAKSIWSPSSSPARRICRNRYGIL